MVMHRKIKRNRFKELLDKAYEDGFRYITDSDARAAGGSHSKAHLWDNGELANEELEHLLEIRKWAINNFLLITFEMANLTPF